MCKIALLIFSCISLFACILHIEQVIWKLKQCMTYSRATRLCIHYNRGLWLAQHNFSGNKLKLPLLRYHAYKGFHNSTPGDFNFFWPPPKIIGSFYSIPTHQMWHLSKLPVLRYDVNKQSPHESRGYGSIENQKSCLQETNVCITPMIFTALWKVSLLALLSSQHFFQSGTQDLLWQALFWDMAICKVKTCEAWC